MAQLVHDALPLVSGQTRAGFYVPPNVDAGRDLVDVLAPRAGRTGRGKPQFIGRKDEGHGTQDTVVRLAWAQATQTHLKQLGYDVAWHTYDIGHEVSMALLSDLQMWLNARL